MDTFLLERTRGEFLNLFDDARKFIKDLFEDLIEKEIKNFQYSILDTEMIIYNPVRNLDRDIKINLKEFHIILSFNDEQTGLTDIIHRRVSLFNYLDNYDFELDLLRKAILELVEKWNVELCEIEEELERERQLERRRAEDGAC